MKHTLWLLKLYISQLIGKAFFLMLLLLAAMYLLLVRITLEDIHTESGNPKNILTE